MMGEGIKRAKTAAKAIRKPREKKVGKTPEPAKRKRGCFTCGASGNMCDTCGEPEGVCDCEDSSYSDCEDCLGTGIASADIEESDLRGDKVLIAKWKKML